jgi:hypothetical protein
MPKAVVGDAGQHGSGDLLVKQAEGVRDGDESGYESRGVSQGSDVFDFGDFFAELVGRQDVSVPVCGVRRT